MVVRTKGLGKRFPKRRGWRETLLHPRQRAYQDALVDVSLAVRRGEFFGLLGRNGAGKTTLFKILATLVLPDAGRAWIDGIDVAARPGRVRQRLVPVIPYERSLYWRLSARDNLRLYAALHGFDEREGELRIDRVLGVVGLSGTHRQQVGLFSSGMKQRLLVARALLSDPEVLLLDEPTRSLDPITARDLRAFLREEINGRQGRTVLLATHDAEEVRELCHRVGILEEGRLLVSGGTEELLSSVGEHRYRLIARGDAVVAAVSEMERRGAVQRAGPPRVDDEGWLEVEMDVPAGRTATASLVREILDSGGEVAGIARRDLPLAELIEAVVRRAREERDGGGG